MIMCDEIRACNWVVIMGMLEFVELSCLSVQTLGWCFEISCFEIFS